MKSNFSKRLRSSSLSLASSVVHQQFTVKNNLKETQSRKDSFFLLPINKFSFTMIRSEIRDADEIVAIGIYIIYRIKIL
jgi:hypothetical protein